MAVTDKDISEVIGCFVEVANATGALQAVTEQYKDNRSMALVIEDSAVTTGFILKDGGIALMGGTEKPTVAVFVNRNTFWKIINAENSRAAKTMIYNAVFLEESLRMVPPPGIGGGALHFANLVQIFEQITKIIGG